MHDEIAEFPRVADGTFGDFDAEDIGFRVVNHFCVGIFGIFENFEIFKTGNFGIFEIFVIFGRWLCIGFANIGNLKIPKDLKNHTVLTN